MKYYTSDTHFFHKEIITYCKDSRSRFNNVEEMNEFLITAWNNKVLSNSEVYHLGDFSFGTLEQTVSIIERLNGKITLVSGNHDELFNCELRYNLFNVVPNAYILNKTMSHFPQYIWENRYFGSIHLHGHTHGSLVFHKNALDVGVDARPNNDLAPWSETEIENYLETSLEYRTIRNINILEMI